VALGAVADAPLATKAMVLSVVAFGMTVAIYGLVAGIVKPDDIGHALQRRSERGSARDRLGRFIVEKTTWLMKGICVVGTIAMVLVGGGIILHGIPGAEAWLERALGFLGETGLLRSLAGTFAPLVAGVLVGALVTLLVASVKKGVSAIRGPKPA